MRGVPYASSIDSLINAMVCTKLDIAHAVKVVSWFICNAGKKHWTVVKCILRILRGTSRACLCFGHDKLVLQEYIDAIMIGDVDSRKSLLEYLLIFTRGQILCIPNFSNMLLCLSQK